MVFGVALVLLAVRCEGALFSVLLVTIFMCWWGKWQVSNESACAADFRSILFNPSTRVFDSAVSCGLSHGHFNFADEVSKLAGPMPVVT